MSNIKLDKNTIALFEEQKLEKIKIFFYDSGCSWTKVDISSDFEVDESLVEVNIPLLTKEGLGVVCYLEKKDYSKFENCNITRTVVADHTGKEKIRYIFSSNKVKYRCWCGSSFSFSEKKLKLNLEELKNIKLNFKK